MAAADRRRVFLDQARSVDGRSPLYDALWRRLADEPLVDGVVDEYRWDTPLRVAAALHFLVLGGRASWDDVDAALVSERAFIRRYVSEQGIQTNEVQRSWLLLPCFLEAARRAGADELDLVELGPSAGLNLLWDRYRYRYAHGAWGDPAALLELSGEERRPVPAELLGRRRLRVRRRTGIDLAPIDGTTAEGARLLRSFVWPDQASRLERLDRALAVLRDERPPIVRGDVAELLPDALAFAGRLRVVVDTAVLGYLSPEGRQRVFDTLAAAGAEGPLAYVRTTRPAPDVHTYYGLELQLWPGGEREIVAHADFHGAWIDWLTP